MTEQAQEAKDRELEEDSGEVISRKDGLEAELDPAVPVITLATAHPAKFPDAIEKAGVGAGEASLPLHLRDLFERPERYEVLPNELAAVQAFMAENINA